MFHIETFRLGVPSIGSYPIEVRTDKTYKFIYHDSMIIQYKREGHWYTVLSLRRI